MLELLSSKEATLVFANIQDILLVNTVCKLSFTLLCTN